MSKEWGNREGEPKSFEIFGFSEEEVLYWCINNEHFQDLISDKSTTIHNIRESSNTFGEFLFVTVSRVGDRGRIGMTFYGLGYHEYRERWFTNEWFWYQANLFPEQLQKQLTLEEAEELLDQRRESIDPYVEEKTQTQRGRLFEMLADLTDEDGAYAEMQDFDDLADWLGNDTSE